MAYCFPKFKVGHKEAMDAACSFRPHYYTLYGILGIYKRTQKYPPRTKSSVRRADYFYFEFFARNCFVRSFSGFSNKADGTPCSTILPPSMKTI